VSEQYKYFTQNVQIICFNFIFLYQTFIDHMRYLTYIPVPPAQKISFLMVLYKLMTAS